MRRLPIELQYLIIDNLEDEGIFNSMLVCKSWLKRIKSKEKEMKDKMVRYVPHDNGREKFMVCIGESDILIYAGDTWSADPNEDIDSGKEYYDSEDDQWYADEGEDYGCDIRNVPYELLKPIIRLGNVKKSFIGMDTGAYEEKVYHGNSILLKLKEKEYLYISGVEMYKFRTKDHILVYYSEVGRNYVPYPVAVGEKYIYLLLEEVYLEKLKFPNEKEWGVEVYRKYYGHVDGIKMKGEKVNKLEFEYNKY